jgi:hypothetical protein
VLKEHFCLLTYHRKATQDELEIGPSKANMLRVFDALLDLIKHADDLESRIPGSGKAQQKEVPRA